MPSLVDIDLLSGIAGSLRIDELTARSVVPFAPLLLVALAVSLATWRTLTDSYAKQRPLARNRIPVQIIDIAFRKRQE